MKMTLELGRALTQALQGAVSPGAAALGPGWGPGAIRALAILQVFLQGCADRLTSKTGPEGQDPSDIQASETKADSKADPPKTEPPRPEPVIVDAVEFPANLLADLEGYYLRIEPRGAWRRITARLAAGQGAPIEWTSMIEAAKVVAFGDPRGDDLTARLTAHFERRSRGEADRIADLDALLAAAEAWPLYDDYFAGYVWLRAMQAPAPDPDALAALLARIERHLRVTHALLRASLETGRVEFSAWRSKAGPPPGWRELRVPTELGSTAARLYPNIDADTWASEGTLPLVVEGSRPLILRRAGQQVSVAPGGAVTLRRLDLLEVPAAGDVTVRSPTLGPIRLPAGATITAFGIAAHLGDEARATIRDWLRGAIDGDEAALSSLQAALPAAHPAIREALAGEGLSAEARGRLTMVLVIFDE